MQADDLTVQMEECANGVVLLRLGGYLDAHTYERLDQQIARLFADKRYKLVVDLSGVGYISSAGAGVFIGALTDAQEQHGNVVLLNPSPNVHEVLDMLGFNQIFKIAKTQEDALRGL